MKGKSDNWLAIAVGAILYHGAEVFNIDRFSDSKYNTKVAMAVSFIGTLFIIIIAWIILGII